MAVLIVGTSAAAVTLVIVVGVVMVRPGATVGKATADYPQQISAAVVYARLHGMPLILDRRLRVFASRHDVWSQALPAPDDVARYWSVRRWPQHLLGIVGACLEVVECPGALAPRGFAVG